jgi:2-methylcitrate dehydratase PrpD
MGLAAGHGVSAVHLASCGFGGPPAIFEGKYPLGQAFSGQWHEAELFRGLGEQFKVMELYFKQYACCAFIHPGLDGLLDIQRKERVRAGDIRSIVLRFPTSGYRIIDDNPLRSHCAQYVLALASHKGVVDFHDILHDRRSDPAIASLSKRTQVIGDDELDRTYPDLYRSIIEVETVGGARHVRDVTHPKGSPEHPLTREDITQKFARLTSGVVPGQQADAISKTIGGLEELGDIGALAQLLRAGMPAT